ncbi:aspyridone synthetase trans-acting enoyl reductase [Microdochium nivale]|nr:aspyridone synthetase trans-acting enoyl reductase [Microdochium nivale]
MTDTVRRRRRPAVSCTLCRRRKIRCNREAPCNNCVRSGNADCIYDGPPPKAMSTTTAAASSPASSRTIYPLLRGTVDLSTEHRQPGPTVPGSDLARPLTTPSPSSASNSVSTPHLDSQHHGVVEEMTCHLAESFHKLSEAGTPVSTSSAPARSINTTTITRSITHKGRTFGQSHWIGASLLFWDLIELFEPHLTGPGRHDNNAATASLLRCKTLARVIKARRSPPWPTPPTPQLPSRQIADRLVQCYLRTTERLYRVLHVPSFMRDYEAIWSSSSAATEKQASFLVQLKLVLAIGAVTHDATFSLRRDAIRWIYEAQTWLAEPCFKSRMLTLQSIQTHALLLIAQELVDIGGGGDGVWVGAGALFRRAVHLGLHRDPAHLPRTSLLVAEMRRRLWNTILELNLQFCMSAGTPPGLALEDWDTLPPGNYNDDQLIDSPTAGKLDVEPRPDSCYTETSLARALRATLPVRLAAARALNNIQQPLLQQLHGGGTGTAYEQTLRLDGELRAAHRELCGTLEGYCRTDAAVTANTEAGASIMPSPFEIRVVDILFQRYLCSLHIPYVVASLAEKGYAYSRKAALEAALRTWYLVYPPGAVTDADENTLARYTINGHGLLRTTIAMVPIIIAKELCMQRQEDLGTSLSSSSSCRYRSAMLLPMRPDLIAVLDAATRWHRATLESGETTMKGYLFAHGIAAYVRHMAGGGMADGDEELVRAIVESFEHSATILEAQVTMYGGSVGGMAEGGEGVYERYTVVDGQGWESMLTDAVPDGVDHDPMSWMLGDDDNVFAQEWLLG